MRLDRHDHTQAVSAAAAIHWWWHELRYLLPAWLICFLTPLPLILLWQPRGRTYALMCFFLGCTIFVAYSFRRDVRPIANGTSADNIGMVPPTWRERIMPLVAGLLAASVAFSVLCLVAGERTEMDWVAPMLAFMAIVPALCITPFLTLATKRPFAAVVFTVSLVACMKFAGAIIVVLVYGWYAAEEGRTTMTWHQPDLLVWLFWTFTTVLSLSSYVLGAKRFQGIYGHPA